MVNKVNKLFIFINFKSINIAVKSKIIITSRNSPNKHTLTRCFSYPGERESASLSYVTPLLFLYYLLL